MAPAAKKTKTITFTQERETKNKVRFAEDGKPETHAVGTLYVSKSVMESLGNPQALSVTITAA